ncbi:STAS domain-containing protein [Actinoplanes sp. DH11]|uniref:STAS domain-containing protein n=1 Tax=Actinoplanes sp. DH11 TaxID=2857011 RepID=UPI001E434A43|nr:STAS domain-containing protein [Actinoplanes sp. DH11]
MTIRLHHGPAGTTCVTVTGEIDLDTADDLHTALRSASGRAGTRTVVVDFADVTFCDSSGVAVLDEAYGTALDRRIDLRLVNPQPAVRRVLEILGMDRLYAGS